MMKTRYSRKDWCVAIGFVFVCGIIGFMAALLFSKPDPEKLLPDVLRMLETGDTPFSQDSDP